MPNWATDLNEYYQETYGGIREISEADWNKAFAYVDKITFGRIAVADEDVKNAVCAVADVIHVQSNVMGLSSEDIDGYKVGYHADANYGDWLYSAAELFLPAQLLYRGA